MTQRKIRVGAFYMANSPEGQGVKAATDEQIELFDNSNVVEIVKNPKKLKDINVAHFHTIDPMKFFKIRKCRRKKIMTVCHVHFIPETLDGSIKLNRLFFKILKMYTKKFYKMADKLIVVNPLLVDDLERFGIKREKISYIPNFVSEQKFYKQEKSHRTNTLAYFGLEDKFTVFGAGQVQTRKGIIDFAKVAKENPDIQFVWAGGFSFGKITDGYKELKELMENPTSDNLKFIGIVKRDKMNSLYNIADVLFMPSYNETFGMTILEAASLGKPAVLRDLDTYARIFDKNYLKGNTNEEFTMHIKKLATDINHYSECAKNMENIAENYSTKNLQKRWEQFYSEGV